MDYKNMSKKVIKHIGGKGNIQHIGHCATRLRINIKDENKIDKDALLNIEGSHGAVFKSNQVQLIIGADVGQAYNQMIEESEYNTELNKVTDQETTNNNPKKDFKYYVDLVGGFFAELFMPIVPVLITGGVILAVNNFLINFFGISAESGTAQIILAIFDAGFSMLPIYLGFTTARKLKLPPILGGFLGAILVNSSISGVVGLDFIGIPIVPVEYGGSIIPVVLGVVFMYYVDKFMDKIIPQFVKYLLKPFLTMLIVVPFTLIIFGPIGIVVSEYVGEFIMWLMNNAGFIALPLLSILYPYMVMFGIDKATMPIGFQAIESLGYDPVHIVVGFISNLCIGATALAVARFVRKDKEKSGAYFSFGLTGLFGITEPAFYGALIGRPKVLIGTAIGAVSAGLFASLFSLKSFVMGGAPGLFTILFFLEPDGSLNNFIIALITAGIAIIVSYIAASLILRQEKIRKGTSVFKKE
ncbi:MULTISPECIES: PTS transporter subunit EIIC [Clostridia]|uniref:PTS transporter subunit EIIC n=1 Tax=Clostridia TaxID=186801 RepID=UPI000EA3D587|nr:MULTISPECIES: PTS transporter subunit EIIC [Clostridia]NBJ70706.1 protein-N(pi)-phosphohistidine--sugar phosphotransferase [Roseburia sp. 1XD42-34]RKI76820.1 protein-N(pi)-phosphohistidine--sugar phosphotransferase [Clostridium sp. 1xD42-85]